MFKKNVVFEYDKLNYLHVKTLIQIKQINKKFKVHFLLLSFV